MIALSLIKNESLLVLRVNIRLRTTPYARGNDARQTLEPAKTFSDAGKCKMFETSIHRHSALMMKRETPKDLNNRFTYGKTPLYLLSTQSRVMQHLSNLFIDSPFLPTIKAYCPHNYCKKCSRVSFPTCSIWILIKFLALCYFFQYMGHYCPGYASQASRRLRAHHAVAVFTNWLSPEARPGDNHSPSVDCEVKWGIPFQLL